MSLDCYLTITGQLVIERYEPDGDSARFIADQPEHYASLHRGYKVRPSPRDGSVQLRLEGIDAPETHYGDAAQPLGNEARDRFLSLLGFGGIEYKADGKTVLHSAPQTVPCTILSKAADVHGRPISYLIAQHHGQDGHQGTLGPARLEHTVNYAMVKAGYAYPLCYSSMPKAHRSAFRSAAHAARKVRAGVWARDESTGFKLNDQHSIDGGGSLIFPKLFRRCTDFLKTQGQTGVGRDLQDWLLAHDLENDRLFLEPASHGIVEVKFSDVIEQRNNTLSFMPDLTHVVFIER